MFAFQIHQFNVPTSEGVIFVCLLFFVDIPGLEFKSLGKKLYHAVAQGPTERDDDPMGLTQDMRTKVHREAAEDRGRYGQWLDHIPEMGSYRKQ